MKWQKWRAPLRVVLAFFFAGAGVLHFVRTEFYLGFMPPYLPWPRELIYLSGVFEIAGGLGLLVPSLRRAAGWGLITLLLAVFPANVQMFLNALPKGWTTETVIALVRLPLQIPLILWVWWCMGDAPA
jgi:uncharacterized membrane protein